MKITFWDYGAMRASDRLPNKPHIDSGRVSRRTGDGCRRKAKMVRRRRKVEILIESKANSLAATRNPVSSEERSARMTRQRRNQICGKFHVVLGECASLLLFTGRDTSYISLGGGSRYLYLTCCHLYRVTCSAIGTELTFCGDRRRSKSWAAGSEKCSVFKNCKCRLRSEIGTLRWSKTKPKSVVLPGVAKLVCMPFWLLLQGSLIDVVDRNEFVSLCKTIARVNYSTTTFKRAYRWQVELPFFSFSPLTCTYEPIGPSYSFLKIWVIG